MFQYDVEYDVVVVGAGIAGVAAAVQAARSGVKTALIEKSTLTGGLATSGLVWVYLPLCDGKGKQVTFGLAEELLQESLKYGPGQVPDWKNGKGRYSCIFSPASFIVALDEILEKNGVDTWFDTLVCDTETDGSKVTAVITENEDGRGRIRAKCVIDASGSCKVARHAGIPVHDDFNFLSIWAIQYNPEITWENTESAPCIQMYLDGVPWNPETAPEGTLFRGLNAKMVSEFTFKSRRLLRKYYSLAQHEHPEKFSRKNLFPITVPAMPQFRKIFSINAARVLNTGENNFHFDDSIGIAADWRKPGPVWEIPYRSLYPANGMGGFLAAGRCSGAAGDAWEITRVIPTAALTGQACGLAAALCVKNNVNPPELSVSLLQKELGKLNIPLHLEDVGLVCDKKENA